MGRPFKKGFFCLLVWIFCASIFIPGLVNAKKSKEVQKTGTFSSLYYNEEGGDLLGMELRIVYYEDLDRDGYQGTLQIAEGAPEQLILIKDIRISDDNEISFDFVDVSSGNARPITFTGKIDPEKITGAFSNHFGDEVTVLKRKKSYWD